MKSLFIILSTIVCFANTSFAEQGEEPCISAVADTLVGVDGEVVFNIEGCSMKVVGEDITAYLLDESGHDFDWYMQDEVSIKSAITLLKTNHYDQDGSYPMSKEDIAKIYEYYFSDEASEKVMMAEYADSYMSGTGITAMVYLFNKAQTRLIMIPKFVYAE